MSTLGRTASFPISNETIKHVVACINRDIVPDTQYRKTTYSIHISEWFQRYFSFLYDPNLEKHLGEAFHQARLLYKTMQILNFPLGKNKGFVKFQIIQYASICEAVIDHSIETFFDQEAKELFSKKEYSKCNEALAATTTITHNGEKVYCCKEKIKHTPLKCVRITDRLELCVQKGIISAEIKNELEQLYDTRNNIHILKAATSNYIPRIYEAKNAFLLMQKFIETVKSFYKKYDA